MYYGLNRRQIAVIGVTVVIGALALCGLLGWIFGANFSRPQVVVVQVPAAAAPAAAAPTAAAPIPAPAGQATPAPQGALPTAIPAAQATPIANGVAPQQQPTSSVAAPAAPIMPLKAGFYPATNAVLSQDLNAVRSPSALVGFVKLPTEDGPWGSAVVTLVREYDACTDSTNDKCIVIVPAHGATIITGHNFRIDNMAAVVGSSAVVLVNRSDADITITIHVTDGHVEETAFKKSLTTSEFKDAASTLRDHALAAGTFRAKAISSWFVAEFLGMDPDTSHGVWRIISY